MEGFEQMLLCQTKIEVFAFRGKDATGGNATCGKQKEEVPSIVSSVGMQRGCSHGISLGHALGSYGVSEHNPCGHTRARSEQARRGEGVWEGLVQGRQDLAYLSICPAQHVSRSSEVNWTMHLLKIT